MDKYETSKNLLYTVRGTEWLKQFDYVDRENASKLAQCLTLVSHIEFERNIIKHILEALKEVQGTVALFAVREIDTGKTFFEQAVFFSENKTCLDALNRGNDHGSEARIASIIRNLCKLKPHKILNHPTIENMRAKKCDEIIFVDDFIGSGNRVIEFLNSFWSETTIVSWKSFKYLKFKVLTYSGTDVGIKSVSNHRAAPIISIYRNCPTIDTMPWGKPQRDSVIELCWKYGKKSHKKSIWWLGYKETKVILIFEHGCPNNVPSILWGSYDSELDWQPLFPNRVVTSEESSVFPPEIVRGDPISVLLSVGQKKLALSGAFNYTDEQGKIALIILALLAKGQRRISTLSYVTALNNVECEKILERFLGWGLISQTRRLTKKGYKELNAAIKSKIDNPKYLDLGSDYYYPQQLRRAIYG